MEEEYQYDEVDIKIVLNIKDSKNKARYVYALILYNNAVNFISKLAQFIFVFLPTLILFPIWGLAFDIYRQIMKYKLRNYSIEIKTVGRITEEGSADGEQK